MTDISNVVSSSVSILDAFVGRPNFGIAALVVFHTLAGPDYREYDTTAAGLAEMVTDGFTTGHAAYVKASAVARQQPHINKVRVYKRAAANAQTVTVVPTVTTEGYVYNFTVYFGGVAYPVTYTVLASATQTTIAAALTALITAIVGVDATASTITITVVPTTAGTRFWLDTAKSDLTIKDTSADAGIATDLATAQALAGDFYGVDIDGASEAEINAAAAWVEANKKLALFLTHDSDVATSATTDIASDLKTAGTHRCGALITRYPSNAMNIGLVGHQFAKNPGSSNWNNRILSGSADVWTSTQLSNATAKRAVFFTVIGGNNQTYNVRAASGRLFDTTRDLDFFEANLQADILTALLNAEKLPYSAQGKSVIEAVMRARGLNAEKMGIFIDGSFDVDMPADGEDDPADKAAGLLRCAWSAVKEIGIDKVAVSGIVTI